jgi:hypothetical protein
MGITVTIGGTQGIGLLDEADEVAVQDADRGQVVVLMTTLTVRTTDFANMAIGQTVAIGATNFTVRERLRIGDGALTKLLLSLYDTQIPAPSSTEPPVIDGGTF